jgi:hypothetical protein
MPERLTRRRFLSVPLLALLAPRVAGAGLPSGAFTRAYQADLSVLFNVLSFAVEGTISEEIDRAAGRYRYTLTGQGIGISGRTTGAGIIRDGRFMPTEALSLHTVRGRENRTSLTYDYQRGLVAYHSVSHTLLLGRRRQADDVVALPPGQHVDDVVSAELNFAADKLDRDPDGAYRITVVRRARPANEGPDDVASGGYRAELATVRFHAGPDPVTGRLTARLDLSGFSSWAKPTQPARIAFSADRHLASVESSMMLGTTFTLRLASGS